MVNWQEIKDRYDRLEQELASPALDNSKRHVYHKELSYLKTLLEQQAHVVSIQDRLTKAKAQATENTDAEMAALFQEEIAELELELSRAQVRLDELLFPPDPMNSRSVFLEIRAGTGGQEAALFAGDLARMYTNYALKKGWRVEVASMSQTDLKGFREVVLHIQGKGAYGDLKFESGVHRVQRVPKTETSGRIHTSTATVAVMPEAQEVEITINPQDVRIDVYRAGGAGGQHVNKTDSAVRITHLPTGLVVQCQDDRSQHKNKAQAFKMLNARLFALEQEKKHAERSKLRKEQIGTGERAEKARTYNFPQNRVTDHQADITIKSLDRFIEGEIDDVIAALKEHDRLERSKQGISFNKED